MVMPLTLTRADTNTAFTEDRIPRYPVPNDLLSAHIIEPPLVMSIPMRLAEGCNTEDIASAMRDLYGQNQLLVEQVQPTSGWTDGVFANLNLLPVLHRFLTIRYYDLEQNPASIRHAAYRSGAILYLAAVRVQYGIRLSEELHVRDLRAALSVMEKLNIDCDLPVLLWLLVMGGTRSFTYLEHDWFLSKLVQIIIVMDYASWDQVMYQVRGVLWAEGLSQEDCEVLRREVSSSASNTYQHIFA